jgi:hypothetical protein
MKMASCCVSLLSSIQNFYQNCCRLLQNPDARLLWNKQTDHAHSVVVVEAEEDPVDVVGVGVEVTVIDGTGARVEKVLEVGAMVEISVATSADRKSVV